MATLPIYNVNLEVEAVGFAQRGERECGVLIAPWCMNLVLFPGDDDKWEKEAPGKTIEIDFPAGRYHCLLSRTEDIAPYVSLPLFTTVQHFSDQDTARRVALDILRRLYRRAADDKHAGAAGNLPDGSQTRRTLTRRQLLRGFVTRP